MAGMGQLRMENFLSVLKFITHTDREHHGQVK